MLPSAWNMDWLGSSYPPTLFLSMPRDLKTADRIKQVGQPAGGQLGAPAVASARQPAGRACKWGAVWHTDAEAAILRSTSQRDSLVLHRADAAGHGLAEEVQGAYRHGAGAQGSLADC